MIELLDYILDDNDNFWIVGSISDVTTGIMIYQVSEEGTRFNHITKKKYIRTSNYELVPIPTQYKKIFKPRGFYLQHKNDLPTVWKKYVDVLNEIGIDDENIGIFGSYLIGFDIIKDVDFAIYGIENLKKYYQNCSYIKRKLNVQYISEQHILYQYNKHKHRHPQSCDLKEMISRNWSGITIEDDILSTPRFIDIHNMYIPKKEGINQLIEAKVVDGLTSTLLPRQAKVIYNHTEYTIFSPFWKFQSFAKKDDILIIYGNVDAKKKVIILDDDTHYIRYKTKGHFITD